MIKIENVTYRYKKGNDILKKINLEIQDKETVVIMGKNGSGKSTLLNIITETINTYKKVIIRRNPLVKSDYFDMYITKCKCQNI